MKRLFWIGLILSLPVLARADLRQPGIVNGSAPQTATFNVSSGTVTQFTSSTATIKNLVGTTTNDNAAVGNYGQYVSSFTSSISIATGGSFVNVAAITVSSGDWDVSGVVLMGANGATVTACAMAISLFSGATTTDQVLGDNQLDMPIPLAAVRNSSMSVPAWRVSTASTVVVYLKASDTSTVATPTVNGRISARRAR